MRRKRGKRRPMPRPSCTRPTAALCTCPRQRAGSRKAWELHSMGCPRGRMFLTCHPRSPVRMRAQTRALEGRPTARAAVCGRGGSARGGSAHRRDGQVGASDLPHLSRLKPHAGPLVCGRLIGQASSAAQGWVLGKHTVSAKVGFRWRSARHCPASIWEQRGFWLGGTGAASSTVAEGPVGQPW